MNDQTSITPTQKEKSLFEQLVMMFSTNAFQQMGKIANHFTGKVEKDLKGAQMSIDMLDMMAAKTKDNLDPEEERMLTEILTELKMNYVESSSSADAGSPAEEPAPPPSPGPSTDEPVGREKVEEDLTISSDQAKKEPKFYKKYE